MSIKQRGPSVIASTQPLDTQCHESFTRLFTHVPIMARLCRPAKDRLKNREIGHITYKWKHVDLSVLPRMGKLLLP